jgi:hypothetical protein
MKVPEYPECCDLRYVTAKSPQDLKSILERIPATPCRLQADPALGPLD